MALARQLLGLAIELASSTSEVDASIRRAVSTAYYALFHALVATAADHFVGVDRQGSPAYTMIYRAYEHRRMREACNALDRDVLSERTRGTLGRTTAPPAMRTVAYNFVTLQDARQLADYAPQARVTATQALALIENARTGIEALDAADPADRVDFLAFLLAPPR